jgi:uncharacterized protein
MGLPNPLQSNRIDFLQALADQAAKTREGLGALEAYMQSGDESEAKRVESIEKEADELRHILIDELNRARTTPIGRGDLFALSRTIDDVLDYAYSTVDEMIMFDLQPNAFMRQLTAILREAGDELHSGVLQLHDHPKVALEHVKRAKAMENNAESVYRTAIADLFRAPKTVEDIIMILKTREIYRHLSNAADHGDEAANILGDIVVKML